MTALSILGLALGPGAAANTFVVASPCDVHDTALLDGEFSGWNFGGSPLLEAGFMGGIYAEHRAVTLLRFDLTGVPCRTITAAKLRLYKPKCFVQTTQVAVRVFEVARDNFGWLEGSAFCAVDSGGASWLQAKANQPWAGAPGCSHVGSELGDKPVSTRTALLDRGEWMEFPLSTELAQRWLDHPGQNTGLRLAADVRGTERGEHVYFHSSEHWSGKGPQLVLEGTPGTPRRGTTGAARVKKPMVLPADGRRLKNGCALTGGSRAWPRPVA